jgi:hypothetical protein
MRREQVRDDGGQQQGGQRQGGGWMLVEIVMELRS